MELLKVQAKILQTRFMELKNNLQLKISFGTLFKVEDPTASSSNVDAPVYYKNVLNREK